VEKKLIMGIKQELIMKKLTIEILKEEAKKFIKMESKHEEASIYGSTDGKDVGTYLEHTFQIYLLEKYDY